MPLEAIIFDMDGVLVDSEVYWWQSRVDFAHALNKVWTPDDQRHAMGRNTVEWGHVMQEILQLDDWTVDEITADVKRRVIERLRTHLPILPNAIEAVQIAASHTRVALASGSPTEVIQTVMSLTGLDQVFETLVFGDTIANGKPAPDIYLEATRRLGVDPRACLGIEDSGNGLKSLKAAGMIALAVPSPEFPLPPEILALADLKMNSLTEFTPAFLDAYSASL